MGVKFSIVLSPYIYGIIDGRLDGAPARSTHGNMVSRGWGRTGADQREDSRWRVERFAIRHGPWVGPRIRTPR